MKKQGFLSFSVIGLAILGAIWMIAHRGAVKKEEPKTQLTLVETIEAIPSDEQVIITAFGTVKGNRETKVYSQVNGRIVEQSPDLVLGGLIDKDQAIVKIDPQDYEIAIEQAKAQVQKAQFDLEVEQGRQIVAKREWELLNSSIKASEIGRSLALRQPHMREKKAALEGAKSRLSKAELDLARTNITAPFNGIVTEEAVEIGDLITMQTRIATLVSTDEFRVQMSLPFSQLRWIKIPQTLNAKGAPVKVIQELGENLFLERTGEVVRLLGNVDPGGRMARLLVLIYDPLGLNNPELRPKPLLIDTYVRVEIEGPILKNVFVIPREAIRQGDTVWINNCEDELEVRQIHILLKRENEVLIDKGLKEGERVIVTNLALPIPGTKLQELPDLAEIEDDGE